MLKEEPKVIWQRKPPVLNIPSTRPMVILSCAISLDGKLASSRGDSSFSSFRDKREVHKLRSKVDAILVGINTLLTDDPHLTVSHKYYESNDHPIRIVLDSHARTPPDAQFITKRSEVLSLVVTTQQTSKKQINKLRAAGAEIRILGKDRVDIPQLMKVLASEYGVKKLMVEGGGKVIGSFFNHDLIDLARISFTPVVLGNDGGTVDLLRGVSFPTIASAPMFQLIRVELIDWNIVLHLLRKRNRSKE